MMKQATQQKSQETKAAPRNIFAAWFNRKTSNTGKPVHMAHNHKDAYCMDRATD
ncbi:MAG: hypothetical protein KGQ41_09735 [Alphaproteobacteria bacterium]|nr:hypothetical protein [Alphaproteobacteria bacterium]